MLFKRHLYDNRKIMIKRRYYHTFFLTMTALIWWSFNLIDDLTTQLLTMQEEENILVTYTFEGCYGPYHHGTIDMHLKNDTIYFVERSYDDQGKKELTQSGRYHREHLIDKLNQASKKKSPEILGNRINYRISKGNELVSETWDRIEQQHFIDIFRPFSSVFTKRGSELLPGLKKGGFVH